MEQKSRVKLPNRISYAIINRLLRVYLYFAFGYVAPRRQPFQGAKEPIVVLSNHCSSYDFLFAMTALYPKRLNAVVASYFYQWKLLARVLRFFGCIEKNQFCADVSSIRDMRSVIQRGGSLLIYPEGEISGVGVTGDFNDAIVRLVKLLRVNVYGVKVCGSHLSHPKWARAGRKGKVSLETFPIASGDELAGLPTDAVLSRIREALSHDEYAWQREQRIPFRGERLAESLENLLYLCPRCSAEYQMRSESDSLFCDACGNRAIMDEYGFLHPASKADICFSHPTEWVRFQQERLRESVLREDFCLEEDAFLLFHVSEKTLAHTVVGEGRISLSRDGVRYEGTCEGKPVCLNYELANMLKLPFSAGNAFELPNQDRIVAIRPKQPQAIMKFVLAYPIMRQHYVRTH